MIDALFPVWILLMIVLQYALVGGALAAGAWVVWRYLERRASSAPPSDRADSNRDDVVIHWVPLVLVVLAAAWFAFMWPARQGAMPEQLGWILLLAPYVVNIAVIAGVVWLVRKMIAGGSGRLGPASRD